MENTAAPGFRGHPTRPGLDRVERDNPVGVQTMWSGQPTVREAQLPGGRRTVQEANAGAPKGDGIPGQHGRILRGRLG